MLLLPLLAGTAAAQVVFNTARSLAIDDIYRDPLLSPCDRCKHTLAVGQQMVGNVSPEALLETFLDWCTTHLEVDPAVCRATFTLSTALGASTFGTDFGHMLLLMEDVLGAGVLDGEYFCHFKAGGVCAMPETPEVDLLDWWVPAPLAQEMAQRHRNNRTGTFNALHLSDVHLQLGYVLGGEGNCTDGMCCTSHSRPAGAAEHVSHPTFHDSHYLENGTFVVGEAVSPKDRTLLPAATFGSYRCDAPLVLVNNSLLSMASLSVEFDFAIFTGDMVDHDALDYTTINTTLAEEAAGFLTIKHWLGDLPVYCVLGNHDAFPYGQLAPHGSGFEKAFGWNSNLMARLWEDNRWINSTTARQVREHYAGFAVTAREGLKVVLLNLNAWFNKNMYSFAHTRLPDPFGVVRWLVDELAASEAAGERVWLQAHIPLANDDLMPLASRALAQVVARFSPHTITGIFYGHTHKDQFQVGYEAGEPAYVAWVGQSITPIFDLNPAWRYYVVDASTYEILDSVNHWTDLQAVEDGSEPVWQASYSARSAYTDETVVGPALARWPASAPLNATFWHHVAECIRDDPGCAQRYANHLFRWSPATPQCARGECGTDYCYVSSFTRDQWKQCQVGAAAAAAPPHRVPTMWG